jgi:hypothetical protein
MTWDAATFAELAKAREIDVVVPAPGRPVVRAPIWIIAVGGNLYVRSWKGYAGRWYRRARRYGTGSIITAAGEHAVRFQPAGGSDIDAAIDRAYLKKSDDPAAGRGHHAAPGAQALGRAVRA